ncbi:trihelix transcription factor ptl [Phtheirospermum japonicum]|uniref:Trihelix transcription factor ptl n=1 Tax=Phtheirospermum japonicum TaxID=374723 RepID=A0A830BW47_9LAMI|nr:trihelix transcription factor ptl [Phtheirospermum japonicum]
MPPANTGGGLSGFMAEAGGGGDGGAGRWPRQETLTLLEIRSKLDPKFKEANQKGPLWDEVSRIMSEEYGYHRSGKKCREKFENLYKYYKKTKGGKAGRQDGKHYRFFRQLEALYGDQTNNNNINSSASVSDQTHFPKNTNINSLANNNNNNNNNQESYSSLISISNSSDFGTFISSDDDNPKRKKKAGKKGLKAKIKDTIDSQMRKMVEKQEAWMEKMMKTIEGNEQERISREEQWRKQDAERIEREQKMWAGEKAWIEARDAALMEAFGKLITGKEMSVVDSAPREELIIRDDDGMCKEHWDCVSDYLIKKRKESSRVIGATYDESYNGNIDSCFRYFHGGDGYGRIMN